MSEHFACGYFADSLVEIEASGDTKAPCLSEPLCLGPAEYGINTGRAKGRRKSEAALHPPPIGGNKPHRGKGQERKMASDEWSAERIVCTDGPTLKFTGRILAEQTTQNQGRTKSRWTELRLWETQGGNWIAESAGCSDNDREDDLINTIVVEKPADGFGQAEIFKVMEFLTWSNPARSLARDLGWKLVREVA